MMSFVNDLRFHEDIVCDKSVSFFERRYTESNAYYLIQLIQQQYTSEATADDESNPTIRYMNKSQKQQYSINTIIRRLEIDAFLQADEFSAGRE